MDAFVSALQPIETAQGLPNSCYTDPAMFQIEKKAASLQTRWAEFEQELYFGGDVERCVNGRYRGFRRYASWTYGPVL